MTHKALLRQLQISCLGLDHVDPLRLLVDDVIAALAQQKQEPVAWFSTLPDGRLSIKIVGEPTEGNWEPLYTTPPQRTWVGLTDEEVYEIYASVQEEVNKHWENGGTAMMFPPTLYKAIEAKLKEKNT
jgi:hypothetical protein